MHRLGLLGLLTFFMVGLSGCATCVTDDGTYYIAATPTRDAGERPLDITNSTHPELVAIRDAIRNAEVGDNEIFVYEGDPEGEQKRVKALDDLSIELYGNDEWSTIVVDHVAYALAFMATDSEC